MSKSEEWSHDVLKGYTGSYQKLYYAIADEYLETIFKYISNIISRDLELAHKLLDKAIVINNEGKDVLVVVLMVHVIVV